MYHNIDCHAPHPLLSFKHKPVNYLCSSNFTIFKIILFLLAMFQNSGIEKAFLFDVVSKIYIATDSSPVDMQSYELCCDMIDVVIDISCIYGYVIYAYDKR